MLPLDILPPFYTSMPSIKRVTSKTHGGFKADEATLTMTVNYNADLFLVLSLGSRTRALLMFGVPTGMHPDYPPA